MVIDQIITTVVDSIKQIDLTPDWVDDALAEINQNPLNKFQDQLDATANNSELKDSVRQVENEFKDETTTNKDIPSYNLFI
ncbi:hypothetical protein [uncultured Gammaproteobacteria bacterium]|nr:hypothetical protein [uncultured Gammaproteobacteria bacterium]